MCQSPVPALDTRTWSSRPASAIAERNTCSPIGDRQMLPEQTTQTCSRGSPPAWSAGCGANTAGGSGADLTAPLSPGLGDWVAAPPGNPANDECLRRSEAAEMERGMNRVRDVVDALRRAYPESAAADWDTGIGLTCGDPDAAVGSVLLAVDADQATIGEAIAMGAGMLVTHHPLLFRPVQSVAADTAKGALLHMMITHGVAHFAAHTNADVAVDGVNDALADAVGLIAARPLVPLVPLAGSAGVSSAGVGNGRVGELPDALTLLAFAGWVADRLPGTVAGVRAAGDPERLVR